MLPLIGSAGSLAVVETSGSFGSSATPTSTLLLFASTASTVTIVSATEAADLSFSSFAMERPAKRPSAGAATRAGAGAGDESSAIVLSIV